MIDLHVHIHTGDYKDKELLPKYYRDTLNSKVYNAAADIIRLLPDKLLKTGAWMAGVYSKDQEIFGKINPIQRIAIIGLIKALEANPLEKLLESMDENGIERAAVQVVEPYMNTDEALRLKEKSGRIYVFGSVKFCRDNYIEQAEEISRKNIDGFKIHPPLQMMSPGSHKIHEVLEALPERLPILLDAGPFVGFRTGTDINTFKPLLKKHNNRTIILAHIGKGHYEDAIKLAREHDCAYLETSLQPARVIRKAIDSVGASKIFLGSDFPILDQAMAIRQLRKATNESEFEMISKLNAERLLKK